MPPRLTGLFRNGHHSTISQHIYLDALTHFPSLFPSPSPSLPPSNPLTATTLSPPLFHALLTKYSTSPCIHEQERAILLTALAMREGARIDEKDLGVVRRVVGELQGWIAGSVRDEMLDAVQGYGNDGVKWKFGEEREGEDRESMRRDSEDEGAWHDGLDDDEEWVGGEEGIELSKLKPRPSGTMQEGEPMRSPFSKSISPGSDVPDATGAEITHIETGFTTSDYKLNDHHELQSAIQPHSVLRSKGSGTMPEENTAIDIVPLDNIVDASTPHHNAASHYIQLDEFEDSGYMSNEHEDSILTVSSPYPKPPFLGYSPLRHTSIEASAHQNIAPRPAGILTNVGHPSGEDDRDNSISDTSDGFSIDSIVLSNTLGPPWYPSPSTRPETLLHEICLESESGDDDGFRRVIRGGPVRQQPGRILSVESITSSDDEDGEEGWIVEGYRTPDPAPTRRLAGARSIFSPIVTKPMITNIQRFSRPLTSRRPMKGSVSATKFSTPISSSVAWWSKEVERPSIVPSTPSPVNEPGASHQFSNLVEIIAVQSCSPVNSTPPPPLKASEIVTTCSFSNPQQLDQPVIKATSKVMEIYSSPPSCPIDDSPTAGLLAMSEIIEIYSTKADNGSNNVHDLSNEQLATSGEPSSTSDNVSGSQPNKDKEALAALIWGCLIFGAWIAGVVLFLELMKPL